MSDEQVPLIYGTEFHARSLAVELAENEVTRFMVGTQTLDSIEKNQIYIVELNDETGVLNSQVYPHKVGEIWHLHWSPHDASLFSSTYSCFDDDGNILNKCAIWEIPSTENELKEKTTFEALDVKMSTFHPIDKDKFSMICENKFVIWDLGDGGMKEVFSKTMDQKGHTKLTGGKWNPQESGANFCTYQDTSIKGWDLRSSAPAWSIEQAHSYLVRDVDYNRNRCHTLGSCGDDCMVNIWDLRVGSSYLKLSGHSHWVWALRYNHLHDELLLSSSSDAKVILWWAGSVASEPSNQYEDGKLVDFPDLEDSVYRLEWSAVDPWLFAALSYDGRLLIDRVPREHKYKILEI